ncbi:MAG: SUMF1/EgtB/PvdO family nonheme iron enzyme [Kofleriaceae bacterium]
MRYHIACFFVLLVSGCVIEDDLALDGENDPFLTDGKADNSLDADGVLRAANTLSRQQLTDACRIHSLPAGNILARPIADLAALDAIANVGPRVVASLDRCWRDTFRDGGDGGWRGPFGLPTGTVELAANLVIPAFQNREWENVDRSASDVLDDSAVQLESVVEHAQCVLRGTNPGRVYLECRRRKFRPGLVPQAGLVYPRRFDVVAEIASDGTFSGTRLDSDQLPGGERELLVIAGRLEANRTVTVTEWKYVQINATSVEHAGTLLLDLVWGADEAVATFRVGTWDRFDEVLGEMTPVAGGVARQPFVRILGMFRKWLEGGLETERVVDVPAFEIDRTEVTRAAYTACVQEGKCTDPCPEYQSVENCAWANGHRYNSTSQEPIVGLSAMQAESFCDWAGKKLVTTDQWHLATNIDRVGTVAQRVRDAVTLSVVDGNQFRHIEYGMEVRGGPNGLERKVILTSPTQPMSQFAGIGLRCVRE